MSDKTTLLRDLDIQALTARRLEEFKKLCPEWTAQTEADPVLKLIELLAYVECLDNAQENGEVLSNLLGYAEGSRLDALADFYGMKRLAGERDVHFRERVAVHIAGISGMGTRDYYRAQALSAGTWVRDAAVDAGEFGVVLVRVWLAENCPPDALAQVDAFLQDDKRRMLTDSIQVLAAQALEFSILAQVWRNKDTPTARVAEAADALRAWLPSRCGLGGKIYKNSMLAILMQDGLERVELIEPTADILAESHQFLHCVRLEIQDKTP